MMEGKRGRERQENKDTGKQENVQTDRQIIERHFTINY